MKLRDRLFSKLDARSALDRRSLLLTALAIGCANTLLFYWLPWSGFDRNLNLLGFVVFLFLGCMVWFFNTLLFASHGLVALAFGILVPMVSQTGGINSPNLVWMPVLSMAALLLINVRWALIWLAIILLHNLVQFLAVQQGWISGVVNPQTMPLDSAMLTKLNILFFLMFALGIYDLQYRAKMQAVSLRNAELEATQSALLDAQNHKDEFIASVGHELRTPMNAILGLNGVLLDELADNPQQSDAAHHIRDATTQLLRVVNDILDISQLEADRLIFHNAPFALAHTIISTVNSHQEKARSKALSLSLSMHIAPDLWVQADQQRLVQVLKHLLDNAIKFTGEGKVLVRASYSTNSLKVEVEDTGPGIAPSAFDALFNRFSNASTDTRRPHGGAGLGLAVCHRLVSLAGGSLWAETGRKRGALFQFEWPMPVHAKRAPAQEVRPTLGDRLRRFLIVDDHPMNQMVVQLLLKKRWPTCQVAVAQSGAHALQLLESSAFDLVLMDVYMPNMDGMQTTRQLRQHAMEKIRNTPVIGLTANHVASDSDRCLQAGMQSVILKPIDQSLFFAAVAAALVEADGT